jgi:hypothetical protein
MGSNKTYPPGKDAEFDAWVNAKAGPWSVIQKAIVP